ncbi:MAG: sigma-70 family RNA polymerase sigma factor [Planctomycetia bacterium]|nr:sigma-70 family RNA polymerase sigma factor [Planctomycetia bacterium]
MTPHDADTELMLRVKRGDPRAFTELVERFVRPLASFFHRLGADAATAEDCAQDVFLKLFRTRTAYEPRAKFSTYLFSIARHHWIDVVRHRAAGPTTVSSDAGGGDEAHGSPTDRLVAGDPAVDARAQADEVGAALRRAVAALSAEQREVFALVQQDGMRYQEIADLLGIPVGTVKSRVHAVMNALRERLAREGFEP